MGIGVCVLGESRGLGRTEGGARGGGRGGRVKGCIETKKKEEKY